MLHSIPYLPRHGRGFSWVCYTVYMRRNIIQFQITQSDGGYVAEGVSVPVVTQGATLDELAGNIREAVGLFAEGEDLSQLGFGADPSVLVNFELPVAAHA